MLNRLHMNLKEFSKFTVVNTGFMGISNYI